MKVLYSKTLGTHIAVVKDRSEAATVEAGEYVIYTEAETRMLEGRSQKLIKAVHEVKTLFGGFIEEITDVKQEGPGTIAVLVSQDFVDYERLQAELDKFPPFVLITEECRQNYMALRYAHEKSYRTKVLKDAKSRERSVKAMEEAIAESDRLVIFCGSASIIPQSVTNLAESKNIPVQIVRA